MLVGRVQELAALDAALERREGVVAIVGEPGIGKSRLLAEVAARAPGEALAARASEAEHDLPYAVWNEALGDRRIELSDARLVEGRALAVAGDRAAALAVLTEAERTLDAFGTRRLRDDAVRKLRRLGRRVQRRSATGDTGPLAPLT